jgi:hypothetical protein
LESLRGRNFYMNISEIARELKGLTKQAQINYSNEVKAIIKYRVKDKHRIETLLDLMGLENLKNTITIKS